MNADPDGNVGANPKAAADQPPALRRGAVINGVLSEPSAARDRLLELL